VTRLSLVSARHPLARTDEQKRRLRTLPIVKDFGSAIGETQLGPRLLATGIEVFQLNVGRRCNQTCHHCHVDAGPDRTEVMPDRVVDAALRVFEASRIPTLDITGGAPELHPRFEEMIERGTRAGRHVMDRCNLTILATNAHRHLPEFFAKHRVEVVASLPYHDESGTDAQRGAGVFEKSLEALRMLNAVGYGRDGSGQVLTLVANPVGAFLPAPQKSLEADFKRQLARKHGVEFTRLLAITNMPIGRYLEWLDKSGNTDGYMQKLASSFNADAAAGVMCRSTISIGYDGTLYDCDFNQMLDMPVTAHAPQTIFDWDPARLERREIEIGNHCFGCTAGQGSSCGGATA
jgi:radical SAM/Cys-rich protein